MTSTEVERVSEKTLEALYNINKHAKKYAELADKNYCKGKKATAKQNSLKKKALYGLKSEILSQIEGSADKVVVHEIDGRPFYCLYIDGWSYHTPVDRLSIPDERVESEEELGDFETGSEKEHSDLSLKESLLHLQSEFRESANDHLEQERVSYGRRNYFAGWSYLD